MKSLKNITLQAGEKAFVKIKDAGLSPDDVQVMAGAAGGPKWLILAHLDRYLFGRWFADRKPPLFLVGSSIGAWRFAAASQKSPVNAIDRLEQAYVHQTYDASPSPAVVTSEAAKILNVMIGDCGDDEILSHPCFRLNIMTVRSKALTRQDGKGTLLPGLLLAAMSNLVSRNSLKLFFERALFYDCRNLPPFYEMNQFPIHRVELSRKNIRLALMASGAIPLVMEGIRNIPNAPAGTFRDGGVIDYHLDIPFLNPNDNDGIVLYTHFVKQIIPGWLDKKLFWRRPSSAHLKNVLLVSPSRHFLDRLPYQKIPDRNDFYLFRNRDAERIAYWKTAVAMGREMADEFMEAVDSGRIRDHIRPIL
ncbi:MAG: patatin-like phospholipase family protein [Desulfobacterales bacterium]